MQCKREVCMLYQLLAQSLSINRQCQADEMTLSRWQCRCACSCWDQADQLPTDEPGIVLTSSIIASQNQPGNLTHQFKVIRRPNATQSDPPAAQRLAF